MDGVSGQPMVIHQHNCLNCTGLAKARVGVVGVQIYENSKLDGAQRREPLKSYDSDSFLAAGDATQDSERG